MGKGIENSLFESWEELIEDQLDLLSFTNAVLRSDLHGIAKGTMIPSVAINFEESEMMFYGADGKVYAKFQLGLVSERVS